MSNYTLQTKRNESRKCNEHVLSQAGFLKVGNSSLYNKGEKIYILSPGISKGKHGKYWFDIRMKNLEKINIATDVTACILLRIVPNWFAFFTLSQINKYLNQRIQEDRAHSGKVWGFYCELNEEMRKVTIKAKNDKSSSFSTELLDLIGVKSAMSQI